MSEISAVAVKKLREKTGLPMMDCKSALTESGGDETKAIELLRKRGAALLGGRANRETAFGRFGIYCGSDKKAGAIVDDHVVADLRQFLNLDDPHMGGSALTRVTEVAAVVRVGGALLERERPALHVRNDPVADALVESREIEFRDLRVRIEDAVRVRDSDSSHHVRALRRHRPRASCGLGPWRRVVFCHLRARAGGRATAGELAHPGVDIFRSRRRHRTLPDHVRGLLVLAQSLERRVSQVAIVGPLRVLDFSDQHRLHPMGVPAQSWRIPFQKYWAGRLVSGLLSRMRYDTVWDIFSRSLDITSRAVTQYRLEVDRPEIIIRPKVHDIDTLDVVDVHEVAKRGEQAVEAALPNLRSLFTWRNRMRRSMGVFNHRSL